MPNCLWCGSEFAAYTARNGRVKIFCGRKCLAEFNLTAYRIGKDALYKTASSIDIPLRDVNSLAAPTATPPLSFPTTLARQDRASQGEPS